MPIPTTAVDYGHSPPQNLGSSIVLVSNEPEPSIQQQAFDCRVCENIVSDWPYSIVFETHVARVGKVAKSRDTTLRIKCTRTQILEMDAVLTKVVVLEMAKHSDPVILF